MDRNLRIIMSDNNKGFKRNLINIHDLRHISRKP